MVELFLEGEFVDERGSSGLDCWVVSATMRPRRSVDIRSNVLQMPILLSGGTEQSGSVLILAASRKVGWRVEKLTASGGMSASDILYDRRDATRGSRQWYRAYVLYFKNIALQCCTT